MKWSLISFCLIFMSFGLLGQSPQTPNFIVFIADDVSYDDLGCYGNPYVKTPNIDRLSKQSIRFTNAYLTASSCSPSRNSIMTGRYPHNTGAAELHTEPPLDMISFPEVLKEHGYYTAQSGKFHMGKYAERAFDVIYRKGDEIGDGGELSWLKAIQERPMDKPFFMWFAALDAHRRWGPNNFSGTHDPEQITPPYYLADGPETRSDLAKYYDEIFRFDYYIGEVIKELQAQDALENTMIIIMADNGRPFPHSKTRVNDRGMKTPFLVYWQDKLEQEFITSSLVSSIDIAPTILGLADIDIPISVQGISFEKLIETPNATHRKVLFAEHNWHDYEAHERMVRDKDFLYIRNSRPMQPQMGPADAVGSPSHAELNALKASNRLTSIQADIFVTPRPIEELYDLTRDPEQLNNLASNPGYQDDLKKMRDTLEDWSTQTGDNRPNQLSPDWFMREPGYIKTRTHGVRGEMPGKSTDAVNINEKGPF